MPVFSITYTTPRTNHGITEEVEWVTNSDWDDRRTRDCFQARYPDAAVICLKELWKDHC